MADALAAVAIAVLACLPAAARADQGGAPPARAAQSGGAGLLPILTPPAPAPPAPVPPPAPPPPPLVVDPPERRTLIRDGPRGRLLLGGVWYFRLDDGRQGAALGFARQRSLVGWQAIGVPHNWNGRDMVENRSSHGWYRRELVLEDDFPKSARTRTKGRKRGGARPRQAAPPLWVARFEGVNHYATVYLNGRVIGRHAGGYSPFEVDLRGLRPGRNQLVVRASTLRGRADLTHWRRASFNGFGTGGWWNFGGMSREVYVRPVRRVDVERVAVVPQMRCAKCAAQVEVRTLVRNVERKAQQVALTVRLGKEVVATEAAKVAGDSRRELESRFTIRRPRLWRLGRGHVYGLNVTARVAADRPRPARARSERGQEAKARSPAARTAAAEARYHTAFGVRRLHRLSDGRVLLNDRPMRLRGASLHEDDPALGAAWGPAQRREAVGRLRELGATVARAHYPLHPATLEALDRSGVLAWGQAPVYQLPEASLLDPTVRRRAVAANTEMVRRDLNHPSIFVWSMANELPELVGPGQDAFIRAAAAELRRLDPTRLVAIDRATRIGGDEGSPAVRALDAVGVNEYFGWYRSAGLGLPASTDADLGPHLDRLHAAYPGVALFVTEFGAEANRDGPEGEQGTFAFQTRWTRDHLAIHESRPFVNGSIVWALRDFRVHPTWSGGNPKPTPPYNHKGLLEEDGRPKPVFFEVQRLFAGP